MNVAPTAATRVFAVLGDPVSHSLSPAIHNAAFTAAAIDAVYVALRCGAGDLAGLLRGLALAGGGGNVTVPHKAAAARALDRASDVVRRTGACNTFWAEGGEVRGDNTDVAGFDTAARALVGDPAGARALLVGAGGAASAAACALLDAGATLTVLNRTPERARALRRRLDPDGSRMGIADGAAALRGERFDLVVNATSLGLRADDPLPFDLASLASAGGVLDLVYAPPQGTPLVRAAIAAGIPAADGTAMLLAQAVAAQRRWSGGGAPEAAMRRALALAASLRRPAQ